MTSRDRNPDEEPSAERERTIVDGDLLAQLDASDRAAEAAAERRDEAAPAPEPAAALELDDTPTGGGPETTDPQIQGDIDALGDAFGDDPQPGSTRDESADTPRAAPPPEALGGAFSGGGSSALTATGPKVDPHEPSITPAEPAPPPIDMADVASAIADSVADSALDDSSDSGAGGTAAGPISAADVPTTPAEDPWAGVEEQPGGWRRNTGPVKTQSGVSGERMASGQSQVVQRSHVVPPPAESSNEYSRQKTNVFRLGKKGVLRENYGARLVCVVGADEGAELPLGREVTIGRSPTCNIVLTDTSISREHARLYREGDQYILVDKKSGNGTFVNGERIARQKLASGDEIALGKARFRFIEIGDVFKPVDAGGKPLLPGARATAREGSPYLMPALVSALILLVTLVAALAIVYVRRQGSGKQRQQVALQYYAGGIDAYKNRDWARAEQQLQLLLTIDPANAQGRQYLASVGRERDFAQQLQAAQAALSRGDLLQAYAQASSIGDSVYTPEAKEIVKAVDAELDARVGRARAALAGGRASEALSLLTPVEAIRPGRPEVAALLESAGKLVGVQGSVIAPTKGSATASARAEPAPAREPEAAATATPPRAAPDEPRVIPRAAARISPELEDALQRFLEGDVEGALSAAQMAGTSRDAQVLAAKIQRFREVYAQALEDHRAKRADAAIASLEQARGYEQKISGSSPCRVRAEINRKLADMYYMKSIDASLAERWPDAFASLQAALQADPTHTPSRRKLEDLVSRAADFFTEAEAARQSDRERERAKALYKLVLQMLPSSHEYHRKARQRLDAMP